MFLCTYMKHMYTNYICILRFRKHRQYKALIRMVARNQ